MTYRGKSIPELGDELPYSAWVLHTGVLESIRKLSMPVVVRDGIKGIEGPISVPGVMKFLWPGMTSDQFRDRTTPEAQARSAIYDYLRDTKNLVCITPGNQRRLSVWWVREEWNDTKPAKAEAPPEPETAQAESPVTMSYKCDACDRAFETIGHRSRHFYSIHVNFQEMLTEVLQGIGEPAPLHVIESALRKPPFNFQGGTEMVRYNLNALAENDGPVIATGYKLDRRYALRELDHAPAPVPVPAEEPVPVGPPADEVRPVPSVEVSLPDIASMLDGLSEAASSIAGMIRKINAAPVVTRAVAADPDEVSKLKEENRKLQDQLRQLGVLMKNL